MFVDPPNTFALNDKEQDNIKNWLEKHKKKCPNFINKVSASWFGSPIHYIFTPSSTGTGIIIRCNCGEDASVGDNENV